MPGLTTVKQPHEQQVQQQQQQHEGNRKEGSSELAL